MKVLKFGGTSVGSPERMRSVADIVSGQSGTKLVVLSAISGTTNRLVQFANHLYAKEHAQAENLLGALRAEYDLFYKQLLQKEDSREKAIGLLDAHFAYLLNFTSDLFTIYEERAVLAQGELLSTAFFHYYLEEQKISNVLLDSLEFMRIDKDSEPDEWYISHHLKKELKNHPEQRVFVVQGYICRNAYGEIDNLKRGGSDYTASLVGAAIDATEIQIWTDIDGLHNNDPRVVENTYPVRGLSYDEAAELAYFGAKILHPSSIRPARDKEIAVLLKNTLDPEAAGTVISKNSAESGIKAVAAKDGITAIKIKSGRMLMAYGFLRNVFEVFERYKTPIDMITTSEVAVSVTIDDAERLESILSELQEFGSVEVDHDQVIVCVVGDFLAENHGFAGLITQALSGIPLRMVAYGGSNNNISFLVSKVHKKDALLALNKGVFEKR